MIMLRHGQSEFNLHFTATRRDPGIEDPRLTELGHDQARRAADALVSQALAAEPIQRIVASPYTRALQTAQPLVERTGLPVLVDVAVRERYAFRCDVGSPVADLRRAWPSHDFSAVEDVWWPTQDEPTAHVVDRAARFRRAMAADPAWRGTVVVSHWGFILALTGRSLENGQWLRVDPTAPPPDSIVWQH